MEQGNIKSLYRSLEYIFLCALCASVRDYTFNENALAKAASRGIPLATALQSTPFWSAVTRQADRHGAAPLWSAVTSTAQPDAAPLWSAVTSTAEDGRGTAFTGKR